MSVKLLIGDSLDVLRSLRAASVHCVVTSPPYYGLRDYGMDGQIGIEPTPDAYIERMVQVFREVRRVLRDDGTLWLNIGDSYATVPCRVLDPFGGAGTTGLVADRLKRDAILIEINPQYAAMARRRIESDNPLFTTVVSSAAE